MKMDKQLQKEIEQLIEQKLKKAGTSDAVAKEVEKLRKTVDAQAAKLEGLAKAYGRDTLQAEVRLKKLEHQTDGLNQKLVTAVKNVGAELAGVDQKLERLEARLGKMVQHTSQDLEDRQRGLNRQMSMLNERMVKLEKRK